MDKAERSTLFYFKAYNKFTIFRQCNIRKGQRNLSERKEVSPSIDLYVQRQMVSNKGNKAIQ